MKLKSGKAKAEPTHFLPLERIVDHPEVGKQKLDAELVEQTKASILQVGLDDPLTVWNGGKEYETMEMKGGDEVPSSFLVDGAHRRAAIRSIRKDDEAKFAELFPNGVPVVMRDYASLPEFIGAQLRANLARRTPKVAEILPKMQRLRDEFKMKNKQIAAIIGKSEAYVSNVLNIEEELGDEGVEALKEGEVSSKDALEAAKEVKQAKKAGKSADVKAVVAKAKQKTAARKAAGRERDEKRPSLKRLWKIYKSLPSLRLGERIAVLEGMCEFLVGEASKLPKELRLAKQAKSTAEDEE